MTSNQVDEPSDSVSDVESSPWEVLDDLRKKRRADGLCALCGTPSDGYRCNRCRDKSSARQAELRRDKAERESERQAMDDVSAASSDHYLRLASASEDQIAAEVDIALDVGGADTWPRLVKVLRIIADEIDALAPRAQPLSESRQQHSYLKDVQQSLSAILAELSQEVSMPAQPAMPITAYLEATGKPADTPVTVSLSDGARRWWHSQARKPSEEQWLGEADCRAMATACLKLGKVLVGSKVPWSQIDTSDW